MRTAQPQTNAPTLRATSSQYSLRALLAVVALAASLCAVRFYTGKTVASAVLGGVVISGAIGSVVAKSRWGYLRGAAYGYHLSLLAVLLSMAWHVFDQGVGRSPTSSPMRRSSAEVLRAIQSVVPSARGIPQDARIEDVLCGRYQWGLFTGGTEVYLFPDKTYVCVERMDIPPSMICGQGAWDFQDGEVFMRTDVPWASRRLDNRCLPLMTITDGRRAVSTGPKQERVLLLAAERQTELGLDAAISRGDVDDYLSEHSYRQVETISEGETNAIKDWLYASCASGSPRWPTDAAPYAKASVIMLTISVVLEFVLRRRRCPSATTRLSGSITPEQPTP